MDRKEERKEVLGSFSRNGEERVGKNDKDDVVTQ